MQKSLIVLVLVGCSPAAFAQSSSDVSVLSWNIRRAIGSNNPNSGSQATIAKVVNYLHPDVWNINELGGNNSGYLQSSEKQAVINFVSANITYFGANPVEGKDYYVYAGSQSDGFIGNAIVSRYKFSNTTTYLDDLRGLVSATVQLPNGGQIGDFVTHLKATTNSSQSTADSQRREGEAETDKTNLTSYLGANSLYPAILTGDFNLSEDAGEDDNWTAGNIGGTLPNGHIYHPISVLKSAGFLDPIPLSVNGDKDTISSGSANPKNRFDYNLFSAQGGMSVNNSQVFNTAAYQLGTLPPGFFFGDSGVASDHLPVFASYHIAAVPEPASFLAMSLGLGFLLRRRTQKNG